MAKLNKTIIRLLIDLAVGLVIGGTLGILIGKEIYTKKYTITFDTDGENKIASIKVKENEKIPKLENPVKEGYEFVSWMLGDVTFDSKSKVNKDISLSAKWEAKEDKLTLNTNNLTLMVGDTATSETNIKDNLSGQIRYQYNVKSLIRKVTFDNKAVSAKEEWQFEFGGYLGIGVIELLQ